MSAYRLKWLKAVVKARNPGRNRSSCVTGPSRWMDSWMSSWNWLCWRWCMEMRDERGWFGAYVGWKYRVWEPSSVTFSRRHNYVCFSAIRYLLINVIPKCLHFKYHSLSKVAFRLCTGCKRQAASFIFFAFRLISPLKFSVFHLVHFKIQNIIWCGFPTPNWQLTAGPADNTNTSTRGNTINFSYNLRNSARNSPITGRNLHLRFSGYKLAYWWIFCPNIAPIVPILATQWRKVGNIG